MSSHVGQAANAPHPTGLGRGCTGAPPPEAARVINPATNEAEDTKRQRISMISDAAKAIQEIANSCTTNSGPELNQVLASVVDLLDVTLTPEELLESRTTQIQTLDGRGAFFPERRDALQSTDTIFRHVWVDRKRGGVAKSRFTCADVKRAYSKSQNDALDTHAPTPLAGSHTLLAVYALLRQFPTVDADVAAAFLI